MAKKHDKSAKKPGNTVSAVPSVPLPGFESPEQFTANILRAFELSGEIVRKMVEDKEKRDGAFTVMGGLADAPKLFAPIAQYWMTEPQKFQAAQTKLNQDLIELWGRTYKRFLGEEVEPMVKHTPGDPRFLDREWTENAFFDFLRQAYLLSGRWAEEMIENASTVDPHTKHRAQFYLNQIVSALSPSNFPFSNPEVIRTTFSTGGHNLAKGLAQLLDDMHSSGELLRIRQTDMSAFEVGKNLAITPGKVVYQNRVMQLIQYSPATGTVYEIPLLIVPPWINKYYILDLTPPKSFIKWLVDQGFTVFVVSWVNPDESLAAKTFEDYMREGVFEAADAVLKITGQPQTNALGYCVGGTLLASGLAYMAATGDERIRSATFLAAQTDFSNAGDLLVFIDDEQLKALDEVMAKRGFLDGARMSTVFNSLRPKDLVWPYIVNNYLLGKQPFPFDLLYWNAELDADAARQSQLLSARVLPLQQAEPGPAETWRGAAGPEPREHADLRAGDQGGPYRPGPIRADRLEALRRARPLRAGRIGAYRGRHQPAGQAEIYALDIGGRGCEVRAHGRSLRFQGKGIRGLVVAGLQEVAGLAVRRTGGPARSRRRCVQGNRRRPWLLCEGVESGARAAGGTKPGAMRRGGRAIQHTLPLILSFSQWEKGRPPSGRERVPSPMGRGRGRG